MVYWEKQSGQLCAQHALNSLLQGPYFSAVDLSEIASKLDQQESALNSKLPENMDDTGYFSIQVISEALDIFKLEMIHIESDSVKGIKLENEDAFICNRENHWFTLRNFRSIGWYNLDSTLDSPCKISDTYLGLYILEVKNVYVIRGNLPFVDESGLDEDLDRAIAMSLQE
jgi:ataxin-3